jgi:hypothetical protein
MNNEFCSGILTGYSLWREKKGEDPPEGGVPDRKNLSHRGENITEKTGTSGKEYNGLESGGHGESAATA